MKDLNSALASYNIVKAPEITRPEQIVESLNSKYQRYMERNPLGTFNTLSTELTPEEEILEISEGFRGFTYTPTQQQFTYTPDPSVKNLSKYESVKKESTNLDKAIKFFSDKGFNSAQISGIVGNLMRESALNPKAVNLDELKNHIAGYGRGIAQWSNDRVKNFKKVMGVDPELADLEKLLEFTWYEIQLRPALLKALQASSTVELATDAIYRGFENGSAKALATPELLTNVYSRSWRRLGYRPYNFLNELKTRINHSQKIWNYLNS